MLYFKAFPRSLDRLKDKTLAGIEKSGQPQSETMRGAASGDQALTGNAAAQTRGILFLHIPKTAGTTLKRFLYHRFPAEACLLDPPRPAALEEGKFDGYQFFAGHVDYDFVGRYRRRPFVLTSLRNPIDRALSAYYYQRTPRLAIEIKSVAPHIGEQAAEQILDDLRRVNSHRTLPQFLRAEPDLARKTLGNVQTEYLAGASAVATYGAQPDRLLAIAREHLRALDALLLVERLPESLALINPEWDDPVQIGLPSDNTTPGRRPIQDHTPAEIEMLDALTSLDLDLYRYGEELFEQRRKTGSPIPFAVALPEAANYTFDQPVIGHGWHVREFREGDWYCWTDSDAVLALKAASGGDHELQCEVKYAASSEAWSDLKVSVNGHPVTLISRPQFPPGWIKARIPSQWLVSSSDGISIGFHVARTVRPSDLDSNSPDTRRLGIALSRIRLVAM